GNRSQREDFCELVSWCKRVRRALPLLNRGLWRLRHAAHGRVSGRGSGAVVQSSVLETEIEQIFPPDKGSCHDRDPMVMELYARHLLLLHEIAPVLMIVRHLSVKLSAYQLCLPGAGALIGWAGSRVSPPLPRHNFIILSALVPWWRS
uniref:PRT6_C domain-containing protein n=1 Tax=Macrostomum lignano TaxID=282301 RepID=A0A1I8FGU8_9PLAT